MFLSFDRNTELCLLFPIHENYLSLFFASVFRGGGKGPGREVKAGVAAYCLVSR